MSIEMNEALAGAAKRIQQIKDEAKAQRQLSALGNDKLLTAKASLEMKQEDITKVKSLVDQCKGVLETIEVYDVKSKQIKSWNNSANFQFDILTQHITNLFGNVQYSNPQHKELMLEIVGVPEVLILEVNSLLNSNTRYSALQDQILVGTEGNADAIKSVMSLVGEYLDIDINLTQFTQLKLDQIEAKAVLQAEKMQAQYEEAKLLHEQALSL
jgi:hypothetical protein